MSFRIQEGVIQGTLETEIGSFKIEYQKKIVNLNSIGPITINRVQYRGHISFIPTSDGWKRDRHLLERCDNSKRLDSTEPAVVKLERILQQAWSQHLTQNPGLVEEARRRHLNNEIYEREGKRVSLWNKIQNMRDEISRLDAEIEHLKTQERPMPVCVPVMVSLPFESPQPG